MNHLARYNLIDEAWIPVRGQDGQSRTVGLAELFRQAHILRDLDEPSPANRVALYRLLLAILHRALSTSFGAWGRRERAQWRHEGLPTDAVLTYLEQWRERFWLVHPEHPFMQVAALAGHPRTASLDKSKSLEEIALLGTDGFLFNHMREPCLYWAEALRLALGFFAFTPAKTVQIFRFGKGANKKGPLANSAAFLALGLNISETLLMNLHPFKTEDDLPAWEKNAPRIEQLEADGTLATGPNDRYSRQTRAVLFDVKCDGNVHRLRFAEGLALLEDTNAPDPMVAHYVKNKEGELARVGFREGRALWRDLPSLTGGAEEITPAVLRYAAEITGDEEVLHVFAAGLSSDQGKIERARMELLRLPHAVLAVEAAAARLREDVARAEALYDKLHTLAVRVVALAQPDPDHTETRKKARERVAQSPLADVYFTRLEQRLPALMAAYAANDWESAHRLWQDAMINAARAFWRTLGVFLSDTPRAWKAMAQTEAEFNTTLRNLEENRDAA